MQGIEPEGPGGMDAGLLQLVVDGLPRQGTDGIADQRMIAEKREVLRAGCIDQTGLADPAQRQVEEVAADKVRLGLGPDQDADVDAAFLEPVEDIHAGMGEEFEA